MSTKGPWTADEIKFRDQLASMVKQPSNEECADCTAKAPKWAVFNHGIFVCIKCSGCHRNIGRAISKVKSINLDRWLEEQFEQMCGNELANRILLAHAPADFRKLDENNDSQRERFIEKKYVKRLWAATPEEEILIRAQYSGPSVCNTRSTSQQSREQSVTPIQEFEQQPSVQQSQQPVSIMQQGAPYYPAQPLVVQQELPIARQQPIPAPIPPPQMNIQNYNNPNVESDLLDFFDAPMAQKPVVQREQQEAQPAQPVVSYPQQQIEQQDDFMALFDEPAPSPKESASSTTQETAQKAKFDVSGFIGTGQRNSYKPTGFDW